MVVIKEFRLNTRGDTDIINISDNLQQALKETKLESGILTVSSPGSTVSFTTVEFEPALVEDLKAFFEKVAAKAKRYRHDDTWGDANGYAHIRSSLLGPSIVIPFESHKLTLGTWQQVVLIDFDNRPRKRVVKLTFIG